MIEFNNVSKIYENGTHALNNVNIKIDEGEFVFVVGASGAGKSTFLKLMMREEVPTHGTVRIKDCDLSTLSRGEIPYFRRGLGIVFQDFQLLIDRNVRDNLDFVLKATGWNDKRRRQLRISEVLEQVGMSTKGYKMPHELSGGEQQRIVIARAILNTPEIILADEPTGNLDPETGRQIVELLRNICTNGSTVIMTTHNLQLIEEFPGKVFRCEGHRVIEVHPEKSE